MLTDVVMPLVSGRTLATHLREQRPSTKILFMSGYWDGAITDVLEEATGFLGKHFNATDLTRKVREILDDVA